MHSALFPESLTTPCSRHLDIFRSDYFWHSRTAPGKRYLCQVWRPGALAPGWRFEDLGLVECTPSVYSDRDVRLGKREVMKPESAPVNFPTVMTVDQLSAYLQCSRSTIYRLLKKKVIPAFRLGADWRFNRDSIDQWRQRQEGENDAD